MGDIRDFHDIIDITRENNFKSIMRYYEYLLANCGAEFLRPSEITNGIPWKKIDLRIYDFEDWFYTCGKVRKHYDLTNNFKNVRIITHASTIVLKYVKIAVEKCEEVNLLEQPSKADKMVLLGDVRLCLFSFAQMYVLLELFSFNGQSIRIRYTSDDNTQYIENVYMKETPKLSARELLLQRNCVGDMCHAYGKEMTKLGLSENSAETLKKLMRRYYSWMMDCLDFFGFQYTAFQCAVKAYIIYLRVTMQPMYDPKEERPVKIMIEELEEENAENMAASDAISKSFTTHEPKEDDESDNSESIQDDSDASESSSEYNLDVLSKYAQTYLKSLGLRLEINEKKEDVEEDLSDKSLRIMFRISKYVGKELTTLEKEHPEIIDKLSHSSGKDILKALSESESHKESD
jgi:hypothetical protein